MKQSYKLFLVFLKQKTKEWFEKKIVTVNPLNPLLAWTVH
jgi:hypothetical protein